jgi:ketosteroid isomerase-like protein
MNAKEIIRAYYAAWDASDRDAARALLCDDLKFRAPQDSFDRAEDFLAECWQYAEIFRDMKMLQEVYEDDRAYIAYTFGEIVAGEFHKIRDGKIAEVYVTMNPTV